MGNVNDIKPHFRNDMLRLLQSLHYAFSTSNPNRKDLKFRAGFLNGLTAFALQVGVNPSDFMSADDLELIRKWQAGEL